MKIHKEKLSTRPIVSAPDTLLEPLGKWISKILKTIATEQASYFKSSFELKDIFVDLKLPAGTRIFTADAVPMYTNIPTDFAIDEIDKYYLRTNKSKFPKTWPRRNKQRIRPTSPGTKRKIRHWKKRGNKPSFSKRWPTRKT